MQNPTWSSIARRRALAAGLMAATVSILLGTAEAANASPIVLLEDGRSIETSYTFGGSTGVFTDDPNTPFGDFDAVIGAYPGEEYGYASQTSSIGTLSITATGVATGTDMPGGGQGRGDSIFDLLFEVVEPTEIVMSGLNDDASFSLVREDTSTTIFFFSGYGGVDYTGVLLPGEYRLRARAYEFDGYQSYDFVANFSPGVVPEPGTGLLVALGLVGLSLNRRH